MNLHLNFTNSKVCSPYLMLYSSNTLFGIHQSTIKHIIVVPDTIEDVEFHNGTLYVFGKTQKVYLFKGNKLQKTIDSYIRENSTSQYLPVQRNKVLFNDWQNFENPVVFAIKFNEFLVIQFENYISVIDKNMVSVKEFPVRSNAIHQYMNLLVIHQENGVFFYDNLLKERVSFPLSISPFQICEDKMYQNDGSNKTVVTNLLTKATQYLHFKLTNINNGTMVNSGRTLDMYSFDFYSTTKNKSISLNLPYKKGFAYPAFISGCGEYVFLCKTDGIVRYHSKSARLDAEIDMNGILNVKSHDVRKWVVSYSSNKLYIMNWDMTNTNSYSMYLNDVYFIQNYLVCCNNNEIKIFGINEELQVELIRNYNIRQLCKKDAFIVSSISRVYDLYLSTSSSILKIDVANNYIQTLNHEFADPILQFSIWRNLFVVRHPDGIRLWKFQKNNWSPLILSDLNSYNNIKMTFNRDQDNESTDSLSTISDESEMDMEIEEDKYESPEYIKGLSWGSTLHVWKNVLFWQKIQQRNTENKHVPFFLTDASPEEEKEDLDDTAENLCLEQPIPEFENAIKALNGQNAEISDIEFLLQILQSNSAPTVDVALRCLPNEQKMVCLYLFIKAMSFCSKFEYLNAWIQVILQSSGLKNLNLIETDSIEQFISVYEQLDCNVKSAMCSLELIVDK
eukprot:NODE_2_length_91304_cov_0.692462.p7 type:complete len:677 gc:universal NODE_2_length_91304_cov_0.692462:18978-21008(+)